MTSKKSSVNCFRFTFFNTIKKTCIIPVLVFVYNLIYQLFDPISRYFNEVYSGALGYGLEEHIYVFSNPNNDFFGVIFNAAMLLCPFVTAALIFRYMMNKSAVNVYYSLGVTRTTMFFGKFTAGAVMVIVSQIIPLIITLITNLVLFGSSSELWRTFVYMLLNYTVLEVFVFAVTSAVFSIVGTVIEGLVFSALYVVSPLSVAVYIEFLFKNFLVGHINNSAYWTSATGTYQILGVGLIPSSHIDIINFVADFLCFPFSSDMRIRYKLVKGPYEWNAIDYRPLIFWTILTAVVVLLGWVAFKKRKTEIAGFMGSNPKATFAGVFIISTFLSAALLPEMIATDSLNDKILLLIFTALIFAVVYIVVDAISLRSIKKMFRTLWKYPLHLAIYSLGILIFVTGFFGFKTRIPAVDKIESVSIRTNTADLMIAPQNISYSDFYFYEDDNYYLPAVSSVREERDYRLVGGFTSEEDIQRAIDIHRMLIDYSDTQVDGETLSLPHGERARPVSITIVYHLKNGKTMQRNYTVANNDILCKLAEFTETEKYKELVLKSYKSGDEFIVEGEDYDEFYLDLNHYVTVFSSYYDIGFASPNLTRITPVPENVMNAGIKTDLINAIGKDIEAGTFSLNYKNDSKLLGYVLFKNYQNASPDYEFSDPYSYGDSSYETGDGSISVVPVPDAEIVYEVDKIEEDPSFSVVSEDGFSIPVYENMVNTVNYINSNGYDEYLVNEKTPYAVKIWSGVTGAETDGNYYQFNDRTMLFNGTIYFPCDEEMYGGRIEFPDGAQTIKDNPELIAEYESKARMLYLNCYDGVYAQFLYDDGSSSIAYIPE
ncbi:MAG: hypothetical protein IKB88_06895 [Clostridia bacterium]|nr:hypothetical protein [Clostridia bacterium]